MANPRDAEIDVVANDKTRAGTESAGRNLDRLKSKVEGFNARAKDADKSSDGFSSKLKGLAGTAGRVALMAGRAVATTSALGTVGATAGIGIASLAIKVGSAAANMGRFVGAMAPALASLPAMYAGLQLIKGTLVSGGPAMLKAVEPVTNAFTKQRTEIGAIMSKGLRPLAKEFVKVNFPAINESMEYIASSVNSITLGLGKWINSSAGQETIRKITVGTSEAFAELVPEITQLGIAFGNLTNRGADQWIDRVATGLQRAITWLTRFLNGITSEDIDRGWQKVDHLASSIGDFAGRIPAWGSAIMGAVRWWQAHAEQIQRVRDILGVVAIVVGIATGGWLPALAAAISLVIVHWDKVSAAMQAVVRWFHGTSESASNTRTFVNGLRTAVGDLSSWFTGKLMPALQRAAQSVMPAVRSAIQQVTQTFHENRDIVDKVRNFLNVLGIVITSVVIPAAAAIARIMISQVGPSLSAVIAVINRVVLPGFRLMTRVWLDQVGAIINGAADAFGWVPGVGPKLKAAASKFNAFRDEVNRALDGIHDETVNVNVHYNSTGTPIASNGGQKLAAGGKSIAFDSGGFGFADPGRRGTGGPQQITVAAPDVTNNITVELDGRPLRAIIREEIDSAAHRARVGRR